MDLPQELDDFIKESIEYTIGLPVSENTLQLKLQATEEALKRLQGQYFFLHERLKEKDEVIERSKAEASMNAQALRKFVEENQRLAAECTNLLSQCSRWEKECSLYDHDREALMEFGNEADERAKEAESRVLEMGDEMRRLTEEVQFYKHECETHMVNEKRVTEELNLLKERISEVEHIRLQGCEDNQFSSSHRSSLNLEDQKLQSHKRASMPGGTSGVGELEEQLLDSMVSAFVHKDEAVANVHSLLEANYGVEFCERLLKMWDHLMPSTQCILSLANEVRTLQKDKEHLRFNLHRAEEEVKLLFEENNILDEENKRLLRQCSRERSHPGSGGKHSSYSAKGNKRKYSPKMSSPIERIIDFNILDSPRQPLSPLQHNSPDSRVVHKK